MYETPYEPQPMQMHQQLLVQRNIDCIKDFFRKKRLLVLGITLLLSLGISITISLLSTNYMNALASYSSSFSYYSSDTNEILEAMAGGTNAFQILINIIFQGLPVFAILHIYFKSKSNNPASTPKTGITIMFVMSIIDLVLICLVAFLMLIIMVILMIAAGAISNDISLAAIIIIAVFATVIFGFSIFATAARLKFFSNIRKGLNEPAPLKTKGATAVGVINIIGAVFVGLYALIFVFATVMLAVMGDEMFSSSYSYSTSNVPINIILPFFIALSVLLVIAVVSSCAYASVALGYKKHALQYNAAYFQNAGMNYKTDFYNDTVNFQPPMHNSYPNLNQAQGQVPYSNQQQPYYQNTNQPPASPYTSAPDTAQPFNPPENQDPKADTSFETTTPQNPYEPAAQKATPAASSEKICSSCGFHCEPDSSFCESCGNKL